MRPPLTLPRLYAILDVDVAAAGGHSPLDVLAAWLDAGIRLIQLRAKHLATGAFVTLADAAVARARAAGATLLINDRVDVAVMSGADGVHLGQDDLTPGDARRLLGGEALIGLSTHTTDQLESAARQRVSYLAIGPVFETLTKATGYVPVGLDGVSAAAAGARTAGLPLVAIGGITRERAGAVLAAGADAVAVITDLMAALGPEASARDWMRVIGHPPNCPRL